MRTKAMWDAMLALALAAPAWGQPIVAAVASEFNAMDTNHDGKVSREEHAAAARKMFQQMDANGDGKVTAAEMDAAHEKVTGRAKATDDPPAAEKIRAVDQDGDGMLTAAEHAFGSRGLFDKMDSNHDDFLSPQEMAAGHAAMLKN